MRAVHLLARWPQLLPTPVLCVCAMKRWRRCAVEGVMDGVNPRHDPRPPPTPACLPPRSKGDSGVCIQCPDGSIPSSSCGHGQVQLQGKYCHGVKISWPMLLAQPSPNDESTRTADSFLSLREEEAHRAHNDAPFAGASVALRAIRTASPLLLFLAFMIVLTLVFFGAAAKGVAFFTGRRKWSSELQETLALSAHLPDNEEGACGASVGSGASHYHRIG